MFYIISQTTLVADSRSRTMQGNNIVLGRRKRLHMRLLISPLQSVINALFDGQLVLLHKIGHTSMTLNFRGIEVCFYDVNIGFKKCIYSLFS